MFTGEHVHPLDEKSRVIFPSRLRAAMTDDEIRDGFVLTRGFDGSLLLYPRKEWDVISRRVGALPETEAEARLFQRLFLAPAQKVAIDGQKRVLIPESHCGMAGIEKDVVFLGVGRHVEVWSKERYDEYLKKNAGRYEELAEKVFGVGVAKSDAGEGHAGETAERGPDR